MGKFNEKTKIKELLEDEKAIAVIEKWLPGVKESPAVAMAKNFTIKAAMNYKALVGLSDEQAEAFKKEILEIEE